MSLEDWWGWKEDVGVKEPGGGSAPAGGRLVLWDAVAIRVRAVGVR